MDAAWEVGYGRIPRYQELKSYTVEAFDLILPTSGDPAHDFAILTEVCQKYDDVKGDQKFLDGYIYLLSQLARCANTTELPPGMECILQSHPEKTKELRAWYRVQ
jgi:hypothetical protein